MAQALFVGGLQEPGTEVAVHLDGAGDDLVRQLPLRLHTRRNLHEGMSTIDLASCVLFSVFLPFELPLDCLG